MVLFRMIYLVYINLQASFGCTEEVQTKPVLCTVAQNQWMVIIELLPSFGRSERKYKWWLRLQKKTTSNIYTNCWWKVNVFLLKLCMWLLESPTIIMFISVKKTLAYGYSHINYLKTADLIPIFNSLNSRRDLNKRWHYAV